MTTSTTPPTTFDAAMACIEHAARLQAIAAELGADGYRDAVLAHLVKDGSEDGTGDDARATLFDVLLTAITTEATPLEQLGRQLEGPGEETP